MPSCIPSKTSTTAFVLTAALAALAVMAAPDVLMAQASASAGASSSTSVDITAADFRARIGILAHDSMRGRDTPSPELVETARYVASEFEAAGLEPGLGVDGFLQTFPLTVVRPGVDADQVLEVSGPDGDVRVQGGDDLMAVPTSGEAEAEAELTAWRPRAGSANPDDGILAVRVDQQSIGGAFQRVRDALEGSDASGAILVVDAPSEFFQGIRGFFRGGQVSLGEPDALDEPVVMVHASSLPDVLVEALREGESLPAGWTGRLRTGANVEAAEGMNTIGWLPGSDPELRNEYVIFTAHMDHVGVGEPVDGDSIYNGADDDASGTATIMEVAEAFAARERAPRRSLVFMTVSGEEKGLLGSEWYSEHPVFPLESTVANINLDMVGRNWPDTVVAIGKEHSSLGPLVERIAADHPDLGLTVIDDLWPEENFYFRSDHYNFARKGVPVLFFFSGVHEDYHQPSDEVDRIRYGKTARVARLVYQLGEAIADAQDPPSWDPEAYERVVEDPVRRP